MSVEVNTKDKNFYRIIVQKTHLLVGAINALGQVWRGRHERINPAPYLTLNI